MSKFKLNDRVRVIKKPDFEFNIEQVYQDTRGYSYARPGIDWFRESELESVEIIFIPPPQMWILLYIITVLSMILGALYLCR